MDHMPASRAEAFPFGLRVLVVDDDPTWLKILEKMLRKCSYEVTTCCLARVALDILRERKDKFDIVISDVNMPDMDGFKLLEHVGLEMDLPVIMMSVDGETSRVMKGVQHGACDYLLKPIRMKELRNIWQHVLRKKIHEVKEIESHDIHEDINFIRNLSGDFDERQLLSGTDLSSLRKRKDMDNREHVDQDLSDSVAVKKARVVWSVDLHQKFVNAVNQIGFEKVGPKKILDLMNVPGLTRENVASHLQKYRLYLSRLQKQNEGRSFGGNVQSDVSKNSQPNYAHQNSIAVPQNTSASRFVCTTQKIQAQGIIPNIHGDDIKSMVSLQVTDRKEAVTSDSLEPQKVNSVSQLGVVLSIKGMVPNADYKSFEPTSKHKPWSGSIPVMQFMQYPKHDHEPYSLLEDYANSPLPSQQAPAGAAPDQLHNPPSVISIARNPDKDKQGLSHIKPVFMDFRSSHIKTISPVTCKIDSVSVQVEHGIANQQTSGTVPEIDTSPCIKDLYFDQPSNCNLRTPSRELGLKDGLELTSFPDRIGCFENMGLSGMEFFQYNDSATLTEFHSNWCDGLEFNCEYLYDSVIDECLFA